MCSFSVRRLKTPSRSACQLEHAETPTNAQHFTKSQQEFLAEISPLYNTPLLALVTPQNQNTARFCALLHLGNEHPENREQGTERAFTSFSAPLVFLRPKERRGGDNTILFFLQNRFIFPQTVLLT